jgi:hypothetical protein
VLEREGRGDLVNRDFNGVGASKPPRPKPWGGGDLRWGQKGVEKIQERAVEIALPTSGSLMADGLRVWTGAMKRVGEVRRRVGSPGIVARCQKARIKFDPGWQTAEPVAACPGTRDFRLVR